MSATKFIICTLLLLHNSLLQAQTIKATRENLKGDDVVPLVTFPGITKANFKDAFNVLDECLVMDEPRFGFSYPFIAPGGHYGGCWWQLDASLAIYGTKWVNQKFSENMLRGFITVQKPDGRIPLYGHDQVPGYPTCSSLPKLFMATSTVLNQSKDLELKRDMYNCLTKYLGWWFSDLRKDEPSGLITGVFEESFPPIEKELKAVAQVDLNVELVEGCEYVSKLALELGKPGDSKKYAAMGKALRTSINQYLWHDKKGAYYAYYVKEKKLDDRLVAYTFDPLRSNIAPKARVDRMIQMLTDDKYFNWDGKAITSVSKTDPTYTERRGDYDGAPSWSGDIWTLRNVSAITGLEDIGRYDLAANLSLKTVQLFNNNYTEFLHPADGSGHGVKRYAWSAAQYAKVMIENIFGINFNAQTKTLTISPNLDESLLGKSIGIAQLLLPNGNRLNVYVDKTVDSINVTYKMTGNNKELNVLVQLPVSVNNPYKPAGKGLKKIKKHSATIYQLNKGKNYDSKVTF